MALRIDMEMQHFSHKHPLSLIEVKVQLQKKKYELDEQNSICCYCLESISSEEFAYFCAYYGCEADFCLHKSCAELPQEISHPEHEQHPLLLRQGPLNQHGGSRCGVCSREWGGFIYNCPLCEFHVDVLCVLKDDSLFANSFITFKFHEHPLKLNPRPALFYCNVCGTKDEDQSYICTTGNCPFWIHKSCALLPELKDSHHHKHPLALSYSFPFEYRHFDDLMTCDICHKKIYLDFWVYYCAGCRYFIHVKCPKANILQNRNADSEIHPRGWDLPYHAVLPQDQYRRAVVPQWRQGFSANKQRDYYFRVPWHRGKRLLPRERDADSEIHQRDRNSPYRHRLGFSSKNQLNERDFHIMEEDEEENCSTKLPGSDPFALSEIFVELTRGFLKLYGLTQELSSEINHFSHVHSLKKMEYKEALICDACILPICDSYYSCEKCSYFLHASCAELPKEFENYLLRKFKSSISYFKCSICGLKCNGFAYSWEGPDFLKFGSKLFTIDLKCAILDTLTVIKHEAHPHELFQTQGNKRGSCCKQFSDYSFGCEKCRFYMDYKCALLPGRIKPFDTFGGFKKDDHPIILMYPPFSDHPEEFYCEICEEEMHPKLWIYHCSECDRSFHSNCIVELQEYRNIKFGASIQVLSHRHALKFIIRGGFTPFCQLCHGDLHCQMAFECTDCEYYICYLCGLRCQDFGSSIADKMELILADDSASVSEDKVDAQISINLPADNFEAMVEHFLKHLGFTRSGLAAEISHFSHKHRLNLSADHPEDVHRLNSEEILTCYGCGGPISTPYYLCMECNYFLHAHCAQLPDKIQLEICPSKVFTLSMPSVKWCSFCCGTQGGFFFTNYWISLHIGCAIFSSSYTVIKHKAHPHALVPAKVDWSGIYRCNGCAWFIKTEYALSCADCGFYLHFRCAELPGVFSDVKFHKHPVMLRCQYSANQHPKVVYCEQCKKKIYTISWFYYCSECDQSYHPDCILYSVTSGTEESETEETSGSKESETED